MEGCLYRFRIARVLLIVLLVTLVYRFRPEEMGLLPDGRNPKAHCFGRESFGTIFRTIAIAMSAGVGIGPFVSGYLFDITGNYNMSFLLAIGFLIIACIIVSLARPPKLKVPAISTIL